MVQLATGRGAYRDEQMRHDHFPTKWIYMVRAKGRNKMRVVRTKPDNLLSKIRGGFTISPGPIFTASGENDENEIPSLQISLVVDYTARRG